MNNTAKVVISALATTLVVAGVVWAQTPGFQWTAPKLPFPQQNVLEPIDTGSRMQTRQGVIDFSTSTERYPLAFGTNQGVEVKGGGTLNLLGGLSVINGDLTLLSSSTNGVRFPDNSLQVSSASGNFGYGQICSVFQDSNWRDTLEVPNGYTRDACRQFAAAIGANYWYPGCISTSSVWFAATNGGVPSPNCGWDVPPPVRRPPKPTCGGWDNAVWTGTRWICPNQCNIPQYWKCPQIP